MTDAIQQTDHGAQSPQVVIPRPTIVGIDEIMGGESSIAGTD